MPKGFPYFLSGAAGKQAYTQMAGAVVRRRAIIGCTIMLRGYRQVKSNSDQNDQDLLQHTSKIRKSLKQETYHFVNGKRRNIAPLAFMSF
jgi:hypothetical protein